MLCPVFLSTHYGDVIMSAIASQITSLTIVYSTVYSDADQRKHQSFASLFPFDDIIMHCDTSLLDELLKSHEIFIFELFSRHVFGFPSQRNSNAENVSIWCHHAIPVEDWYAQVTVFMSEISRYWYDYILYSSVEFWFWRLPACSRVKGDFMCWVPVRWLISCVLLMIPGLFFSTPGMLMNGRTLFNTHYPEYLITNGTELYMYK